MTGLHGMIADGWNLPLVRRFSNGQWLKTNYMYKTYEDMKRHEKTKKRKKVPSSEFASQVVPTHRVVESCRVIPFKTFDFCQLLSLRVQDVQMYLTYPIYPNFILISIRFTQFKFKFHLNFYPIFNSISFCLNFDDLFLRNIFSVQSASPLCPAAMELFTKPNFCQGDSWIRSQNPGSSLFFCFFDVFCRIFFYFV